jgi:hypothetical protein
MAIPEPGIQANRGIPIFLKMKMEVLTCFFREMMITEIPGLSQK